MPATTITNLYEKETEFMELFNNKLKNYLTHVDCYGMVLTYSTKGGVETKYVEFPLWTNKKEPILARLQFLFRVAYMYEEGSRLIYYPGPNEAVDFFGNSLKLTDAEKCICQIPKAIYEAAIDELERLINCSPPIAPFIGSTSATEKWKYCCWMDIEDDDR